MQDDEKKYKEIPRDMRRREDRCLVVRIWTFATPYAQIAGWFGVIVTTIFCAGGKWEAVGNADSRVTSLEQWRQIASADLAAMRQELHDVHEWVKPGGR